MLIINYFFILLGLLANDQQEQVATLVQNIPDNIRILNTDVQITSAGKAKIAEKYNSLTRNQNYYQAHLEKCLAYFPIIEREFLAAGVPPDFKYLALQESVLDGNAVSRSQAVGYWQFKEATAVEYQLRIDNLVDERRNVISSSKAAANYFKKSYHYLQNWVYSLLSYNLGLTGARNFIRDNNLTDRVVVDGNTHQYIVHFIAHYLAFSGNYEARRANSGIYLVEYAGGIQNNLEEIAQFVLGPQAQQPGQVSSYVQTLTEYNPWLLTDRVPQNTPYCFSVILPVGAERRSAVINQLKPYSCGGKVRGARKRTFDSREFYADSLKSLYPFILEKENFVETGKYHEILANGVRAVVADQDVKAKKMLKRFDLTQEEFEKFNDGQEIKTLEAGKFYYLAEKPETIPLSYHIASEGDDLMAIAHKYGIRLDKLLEWNGIDASYELKPGDRIRFNPVE